jgi:hypothetical protein
VPEVRGDVPSRDSAAVSQTYSDGEVVRWIDSTPKSGEEPEHPAPTLELIKPKNNGGH